PTYQWQVSTDDGATWTDIEGTLIDGRTEYTIEAATLAHDGNQYRVVASRADREEISRVATLTLDGYPLPQIVQETPAVLLAFVGDHIVLNVEATGQNNITYEWSGDDGLLGTGPSLDLGNVDTEDAG